MDTSLAIPILSFGVGVVGLLWKIHTWRAARRRKVRVISRHDAGGLDIFGPDSVTAEHVIEVKVINNGERSEFVVFTGVESASGERLADDRPTARKLVDDPAPVPRKVPPRGQLAVKFKVPAEALARGFFGFAELATGPRLYSDLAELDAGLIGIQAEVMKIAAENFGSKPSSASSPGA